MKDERFHEDGLGGILFDAALCPQVDGNWFVPAYWRARGALRSHPGGRGGVSLIATPAGECVLKHYRRGGAVARLLGDRYLWRGFEGSRAFVELRLLGELSRRGLPAPTPVAARCRRQGLFYTADLITVRIEGSHTLAEYLEDGMLDTALAERVGPLIARFHREGVWHADLNAHNVLIANGGLYLVDFDRGQLRPPQDAWRRDNLERLRRSLLKLGAGAGGMEPFLRTIWNPLQQSYDAAYADGAQG